jgi:methionyl-tRNA formyltransferase
MDQQLDHGPIIAQEEVPLHSWDTSLTAYERVLEAEVRLLRQHLPAIVSGEFTARPPAEEGNVNRKKDFADLCELDLNDTATLAEHLDRLRALTHGNFDNAYFLDPVTGRRVYVKISLTPEHGS